MLILGGGFTGRAVGRLAVRAGATEGVARSAPIATTRSAVRAREIENDGVTPRIVADLTTDVGDAIAALVTNETRVVVTFPPDGKTDRAIAPLFSHARAIAYVSSTGVYGGARGTIDERTQVDENAPRARARLDAESAWRDAGATIVRAPAIYGPGRGMHRRVLAGEFRIPGDGTNAISRVHVDDLAAALWAAVNAPPAVVRGAIFVMGDNAPVPQIEVIRWLCERLALPLPPSAPLESVDETLRHDRRVDNDRITRALGLTLLYPTYREGFAHCLAVDGVTLSG